MSPTPSNIGAGHLDMSLRELLVHMMDNSLDHVVLKIPGSPVDVSVTVSSAEKTAEITRQVERILT